jgi:hypothetical protein
MIRARGVALTIMGLSQFPHCHPFLDTSENRDFTCLAKYDGTTINSKIEDSHRIGYHKRSLGESAIS